MTMLSQDSQRISIALSTRTTAFTSLRFDWMVVALSSWLVAGVYLDGWAHNHNVGVETFFTPWHSVLYAGFLACAAFLLGAHLVNWRRGRAALPAAYELSLIGVLIFSLGGVADLFWHTAFGVERNIEALFSPPHHLLVIGACLLVSGPWRMAWRRADAASGWRALAPMVFSVIFTWSIITFITQGAHPLVYPAITPRYTPTTNREREFYQMMGAMVVVLQTIVTMGIALLLIRRWGTRLPIGAFTLLFVVNGVLACTQRDEWRFAPALVFGGLVADVLLWRLRPALDNLRALRVFAFTVPFSFYALYFIIIAYTDVIWWRVHTVTGTIFAAGMTGWLVSYLVCPPHQSPVISSQ